MQGMLQILAFNYKSINGQLWDWATQSIRTPANTFEVRSTNFMFIKLAEVLNFAKLFFKCHNTDLFFGVPLRKESFVSDPEQIYWDKKAIFFDVMTAEISINPVITEFTAYFLDSTGWYVFDHDFAVPTNWGHQRGCEFFNRILTSQSCDLIVPEFANGSAQQGQVTCSFDYKSKGSYGLSESYVGMDTCVAFKKSMDYYQDNLDCTDMKRLIQMDTFTLLLQEYYGPNSRCFMSKYKHVNMKLVDNNYVTLPSCQRFECVKVQNRYQLKILLDNQAVTCPYYGGTVSLGLGRPGSHRLGRHDRLPSFLRLLQDCGG